MPMHCALPPLPPFEYEDHAAELLRRPLEAAPVDARTLYLDLAEAIVDQAVEWIDARGVAIDPVEGHDDRWQGGTAARFVCPAAVLVRERGRADLVEPASRALSQLAGGILARAAAGADFPPGVLDLTLKETAVGYDILREHVDRATSAAWADALAALDADAIYTAPKCVAIGGRLNNYAISACTDEWLRTQLGLADAREWVDRYLGYCMSDFTDLGMYRDPGDPMLYDLMVRQNLTELAHHGYDGAWRERIDELLRRAGLLTLLTLSPCGLAPFGGRSNLVLHNEAMAAFVCEHQATCCCAQGQPEAAGAFKEAAVRAARGAEPYIRERPFRCIKNRFDPSTRHGRDSHYGEYANYGLLTASLFARTALLADDTIPAATASPAAGGSLVHLWPAFHRTFATCADYQVEIDTRAQAGYDATGLGRLHRRGCPPELALSMSIAASPRYIVEGASTDRAVAVGPCWRTADGRWVSLAELRDEIEHVTLERTVVSDARVAWTLTWAIASADPGAVRSVVQHYELTPVGLHVEATAHGLFDRLGFEIPALATDGRDEATVESGDDRLRVRHGGWVYTAEAPGAGACVVESTVRANRSAHYRVARFEIDAPAIEVRLSLERNST